MQDGYQPTNISIAVSPGGESAVLAVSGEIDLASAPRLRAEILRQLEAGRHTTVDLAAVTFMDGSGVSAFVAAQKRAARTGTRLRFCNAEHRSVALVLRLTGADAVLQIENGPGSATP
jgi:anti-anti-sigma factor